MSIILKNSEMIQWKILYTECGKEIAEGVAFCTEGGAKAMQQKRTSVISFLCIKERRRITESDSPHVFQ